MAFPAMDIWRRVQKEIGSVPITEGYVGRTTPLYCHRFLIDGIDRTSRASPILALAAQFGGARIKEGETGHWRVQALPSQWMVIPVGCATHWHYSGTADFAIFYFPEPSMGMAERLLSVTKSASEPLLFNDPFVSATALEILDELQKGGAADERFIEQLVDVMLEKVYRNLTTPGTGGLSPRHAHFNRLQKVMPYIREHLADDLTLETLAKVAGVSVRQFRRVFHDALGVTVHRYVQAARLEQARKFLGTTSMPISKIVSDCGFSTQSHLTAKFREAHAATPAEYRRQVRRSHEGRTEDASSPNQRRFRT